MNTGILFLISMGIVCCLMVNYWLDLDAPPDETWDQRADRLKRDLAHPEKRARYSAAFCLADMGYVGAVAVPDLIEATNDENSYIRANAAGSLGDLAHNAVSGIPALIALLKDKEKDVRLSACYALKAMKSFAVQAIPELLETLKDEDDEVRDVTVIVFLGFGMRWQYGAEKTDTDTLQTRITYMELAETGLLNYQSEPGAAEYSRDITVAEIRKAIEIMRTELQTRGGK